MNDLAHFISALHSIDLSDVPGPPSIGGRGVALQTRDEITRTSIAAAAHLIDAASLSDAWDDALSAEPMAGEGSWIHGDIASGNLLFTAGRLTAVIDFAMCGVGDPACDLLVAWELFGPSERDQFRQLLDVDEAVWRRARGWALSTAALSLPYYEHTNQFMADQSRHKIANVLSDF